MSTKVSNMSKGSQSKKKFAFSSRSNITPTGSVAAPVASSQVSVVQTDASSKNANSSTNSLSTRFQGQSNAKIAIRDEFLGSDLHISNCENCIFYIEDHVGALRMDRIKSCTIYVAAVSGSVHIDFCENCTFIFNSRQLRIHDATFTDFYLHVQSGPIIERSSSLRFGQNEVETVKTPQFEKAGLDISRNLWYDVQDFNWLKTQHSPNWCTIDKNEDEKAKLQKYIYLSAKQIII